MEPLTLSLSQVATYLGCPLKYRFQYVDRIPRPWRPAALAFGTSIHAAVEWIQRERLAGRTPALEGCLTIFEADWYAQTVEPLVFGSGETPEGVMAQGRAMLEMFLAAEVIGSPVAIEEPFLIDLADPETGELYELKLRGIVDLVEDGETVVDLKTAARSLGQGDLERHLQLSTYALAWFLRFGRIPKLRLDVLLKGRKPRFERFTTSRSVEDLAWTAQLIREVGLAIETEHFFPNPSWRCNDCEYFGHCQRWRGFEPVPIQIEPEVAEGGVGAAAT